MKIGVKIGVRALAVRTYLVGNQGRMTGAGSEEWGVKRLTFWAEA